MVQTKQSSINIVLSISRSLNYIFECLDLLLFNEVLDWGCVSVSGAELTAGLDADEGDWPETS